MRFGIYPLALILTIAFCQRATSQPFFNESEHASGATVDQPGYRSSEDALKNTGFDKRITEKNNAVALKTSSVQDTLKIETGPFFAGTWIEYDEKNVAHQVVAVTSSMIKSKTASANPSIKYVYVKYSLDQLEKISNNLLDEFMVNPNTPIKVTSTNIDLKNNKISVRVESESNIPPLEKLLSSRGYDMNMLKVEWMPTVKPT